MQKAQFLSRDKTLYRCKLFNGERERERERELELENFILQGFYKREWWGVRGHGVGRVVEVRTFTLK